MTPMMKYLMELTNDGPVVAQIAFKPGVTMTAGALARGPVEGMFKLGTTVRATENTPGDYKPGDVIMTDIVFEPDAVMQVIIFQGVEKPSPIVMA